MLLVFGAIPFTDAMIVKYIDDRMRSRVTGARLAIGFGVSSFVVALIGPAVKAAGFPMLLMVLAGVAFLGFSPSRCSRRARDGPGGAEARRVTEPLRLQSCDKRKTAPSIARGRIFGSERAR